MSKCWYCNNELTTGDNPKHFGICNKCYDEMFKSSDTIIRSFTNKIADLEAKLAERDKVILILEKQNKALSEEEDLLTEKLKELGVDCIEDLGKLQNQKALEQLDKVKDKFGYKHNSQLVVSSKQLVDFIDQQIKQLKENKNENRN